MAQSLKKNLAYKGLLTIANYIIGFLTFPYITRVLGPEKYGLVNFVLNTIDYFVLFSTMGIGILGIREIAKVKNDKQACSRVFSNLLGLNLLFTIVVTAVYILYIILIPKFHEYQSLFYIGIAKIIFTVFLLEWFFTGIEDFRYITIRSLLIRISYLISVICFVKTESDYFLYFNLTIATIAVNSLLNILYTSKQIRIEWHDLFSFRYLKKAIILGIYALMTSAYMTFNVMFLGLVTNDTEVGYYTAAFRLYAIILSLFTAYSSVMMPRMSTVISNNDTAAFAKYISLSVNIVSVLAVPIILCGIILSPQIIYVLSGDGFHASILPMQILMPAILFVTVAQILVNQILIPLKYDRITLHASILGALLAVLINIIFVQKLGACGSAIVLLASEGIVTTFYLFKTPSKYLKFFPSLKAVASKVLTCIPSVIYTVICYYFIPNPFVCLIVCGVGVSLYTALIFRNLRLKGEI